MEAEWRPGHFDGVATVVARLFALAKAESAYFGLKDYQQFLVIRRMALDLGLPVKVQGCGTVREADGLALSSRNRYLDPRQRELAAALSAALREVKRRAARGERSVSRLEGAGAAVLEGARPEDPILRGGRRGQPGAAAALGQPGGRADGLPAGQDALDR